MLSLDNRKGQQASKPEIQRTVAIRDEGIAQLRHRIVGRFLRIRSRQPPAGGSRRRGSAPSRA